MILLTEGAIKQSFHRKPQVKNVCGIDYLTKLIYMICMLPLLVQFGMFRAYLIQEITQQKVNFPFFNNLM